MVLWQDAGPLVPQPELTLLKRSIGPRAGNNGEAMEAVAREANNTREVTMVGNEDTKRWEGATKHRRCLSIMTFYTYAREHLNPSGSVANSEEHCPSVARYYASRGESSSSRSS